MEVKITDLSKVLVNKIDYLAKEKGLKRNEFLRIYINNIANKDEIFNVFSKYESLLNRVEQSIKKNNEIIEKIEKYL